MPRRRFRLLALCFAPSLSLRLISVRLD